MITDPWFYAVAAPAVLLFGISKGGFGGGLGVAAVPLMALVVSPLQAAAILLPILCVMDLVALWKFRGKWVWPELRVLLPASLFGILVGTFLFEYMSDSIVRLIVGVVAITFTMHYWINKTRANSVALSSYPRSYGIFGGSVAGFTSFVAHAGGPPYQIYTLPLKLDPKIYTGTSVLFFAVVNAVKLVPYFFLGQFDA